MMEFSRILIRAPNWVGDAVISLPALRLVRERFPAAHIAVLARPWVADLYRRESFADQVIPYTASAGARDWRGKWKLGRRLRAGRFEAAILFQNAFDAALLAWLARVPRRIGYNRDGRGLLLTDPIAVPRPDEVARHEIYYYLEMLHRAGIIDSLPEIQQIRLEGAQQARRAGRERLAAAGFEEPVIGVSPGAAFGGAKRWLPERFAEVAGRVAAAGSTGIALFGSARERPLAEEVAAKLARSGCRVHNFAGETTLAEFIEMAAACRLFLTNDSGAMHVAAAAGVPTVAVFGPTDHLATAPVSPLARVVREPVECSPCMLRECPTDHRCMTRLPAARVANVALKLFQ